MLFSFRWRLAIQTDPLGHWRTPAEYSVLMATHQHMDNETGRCYLTRDTIAREARVHPSTVSEIIRKAKRLGWLKVVRRYNKSNIYIAQIPEEVSGALASKARAERVSSRDGLPEASRPSPETSSTVASAEPNSLVDSPRTRTDEKGVLTHALSAGELSGDVASDAAEPTRDPTPERIHRCARLFMKLNPLQRKRLAQQLGLREASLSPLDMALANPSMLVALWEQYPDPSGLRRDASPTDRELVGHVIRPVTQGV